MIPDFTTLVAVDRKHLPELAAVFPTWRHFKPELFTGPFWVVRDMDVTHQEISDATHGLTDRIVDVTDSDVYLSQREKMLTALVRVCDYLETPYYLKLDTDAVAMGPGDWIQDDWFNDWPDLIASPWGYTKPASYIDLLDKWAEQVPVLQGKEPPARTVVGNIARSKRIISWCMFGNTRATRGLIDHLDNSTGGRLPVPSQDTTLWYYAERMGLLIRRVRMAKYKWRHVNGTNRLRTTADNALSRHGFIRGAA